MHRLTFPIAAIGVTLIVLLTVLGGLAFPGYSHLSQFISELGARGAPSEMMVRLAGFLPAGLLLCLFAWLARSALPASSLTTVGLIGVGIYAAGYVVAAFFPCDLGCRPADPSVSQLIHNAAGMVGYVLAPGAMLCLAIAALRWPGAKYLAVAGFLLAIVSAAGLITLSPNSPYVGLSQRLIEISVLSWVLLCAFYIRSRAKREASPLA